MHDVEMQDRDPSSHGERAIREAVTSTFITMALARSSMMFACGDTGNLKYVSRIHRTQFWRSYKEEALVQIM
jgi:hypothetical protein